MQNAQAVGGYLTLPQKTQVAGRLSHRRSTIIDDEFLLTLFGESRPELALLPEALRPALTRMQFDSQLGQYRSSAPDAVDWILELDIHGRTERVGRCYVRQGPQEHRLLDLAIRCQWRRHGLAGSVLAWLCAGAAEAGVPLRLSVWHANHEALRLYHRHGFVVDDADHEGDVPELAGYRQLHWSSGAAR